MALKKSVRILPLVLHGIDPVSYTHLDVYKRQVTCCLMWTLYSMDYKDINGLPHSTVEFHKRTIVRVNEL